MSSIEMLIGPLKKEKDTQNLNVTNVLNEQEDVI